MFPTFTASLEATPSFFLALCLSFREPFSLRELLSLREPLSLREFHFR